MTTNAKYSIDTINDELQRLDRNIKEMVDEVAHLESGNATWLSGKPLGKLETERQLAGARRQVATLQAMRKAIADLLAGQAEHMTAETRRIAKQGLAGAKARGYGDDSTTDYLAKHIEHHTQMGREAAENLAYEIVHKLKCQI